MLFISLKYWGVNNLHGCSMLKTLPANKLKLMFNILKFLHNLCNDLPFLPGRMKIRKVQKLIHDKTEYIIHIRKNNH